MKYFHSVTLNEDKCKGCINCVKRCPTEAIRVKQGKAHIIAERCIDCGECIRVCPNHAKRAIYDHLDELKKYRYTVASPAPALYGQFNNLNDIDYILAGLLELGFDDIFEVAKAAELVSEITRKKMQKNDFSKPLISTACPAVVRMIKVRFPELMNHLLEVNAPVEVAAKIARKQAVEKTGYKPEEIGIFFISPCPAKVTAAKNPIGTREITIDGVLAISDIYKHLLSVMGKIKNPPSMQSCGLTGISWSYTGGEATALLRSKYLAADSIENVIQILESIEDEKLTDLDFVELGACPSGCVGGCLTMENPFIARTKVRQLRKYLPVAGGKLSDYGLEENSFDWDEKEDSAPIMVLDTDRKKAMEKIIEIQRIESILPGIDCAACGSPSCHAFAEDVAAGNAKEADCVFVMRNKLKNIMENLTE
ncbi:MAG: 4Fe-4S dicluster domain-containing protein [Clostridia bacterium]|nr:4Fe-4S dicluster domain-containing protein [Clostridia bacterium]